MLFSKLSAGILAIATTFSGLVAAQCDDGCIPSTFYKAALKERVLHNHNLYRKEHGVPALQWSDSLAAAAQAHANTCVWGHAGNLNTLKQGENLGAGHKTPYLAVSGWGNERDHYSWASPGFSSVTGHFTQVVWKGTTHIGCAARSCKGIVKATPHLTRYYTVCRYSPPGNWQGQFPANVLPKSGNHGAGQDPQRDTGDYNDTIPDEIVPGQVVRKDQTWPVPWPKPNAASMGVLVDHLVLAAMGLGAVFGAMVFF